MKLEDIWPEKPRLNRYALYLTRNEHDANDLVSMTILKTIEIIRFKNPTIVKPRSYMLAIMRTTFIREFCQKKKVDANSQTFDEWMVADEPKQEASLMATKIMKAISEKDNPDKSIIQKYISGETKKYISETTAGFRTSPLTITKIIDNFREEVAA